MRVYKHLSLRFRIIILLNFPRLQKCLTITNQIQLEEAILTRAPCFQRMIPRETFPATMVLI